MAFVYSKQRFQETEPQWTPGPGSYNLKHITRTKHGFISPVSYTDIKNKQKQSATTCSQFYLSSQDSFPAPISANKYKQKRIATPLHKALKQMKEQIPDLESITKKAKRINSQNIIHQKGNKSAKIYGINRQKSAPSLAQVCHEGLCIELMQGPKKNYLQTSEFYKKRKQMMSAVGADRMKLNKPIENFNELFITTSNQPGKVFIRKVKTAVNLSKNINVKKSLIASMFKVQTQQDPTGIEDSSQDSVQYIKDSTPGPGSYFNDQKTRIPYNPIQKFGVTVKRFQQPKAKTPQKFYISPEDQIQNKPIKKNTKEIAFGKVMKQQNTIQLYQGQQQFTQDPFTIQKKSVQQLLNNFYSPGSFLSKKDRFSYKNKDSYYGPDFYYKNEQKNEYECQPQSNFCSKVPRLPNPPEPVTQQVQYKGQQYYSIEKKQNNQLQQNDNYQKKPIPFMTNCSRFDYQKNKDKQNKSNVKNYTSIQKKKQSKKMENRVYTFNKEPRVRQNHEEHSPPVGTYKVQKKWVKPSFNIKFQTFDK